MLALIRVALVALVVAWLFDVGSLRDVLPIWAVFLIALGLEVHFFLNAWAPAPLRRPDRGPQPVDLERYGYQDDRLEGEDVWEELPELEPVPPGLPFGRLLVGLGVIAALATLIWIVDTRSGWDGLDREERREAVARFSEEASLIAGKPVRIRCDESGEFVGAVQHADGVAEVGGDLAFLTPERCFDLYRLAFEDEEGDARGGRAIAVLAHEAWHLRGERDEGVVNCYAFQSGVELGRRLGLSRGTAARMMRQQLVENQLRRGEALEYRVPPDCRDRGALDLDRTRAQFP